MHYMLVFFTGPGTCVSKADCIFMGSIHTVAFVCLIVVADTYCIWSINVLYVLSQVKNRAVFGSMV